VLDQHLAQRALKGALTAEPFIDYSPKGILIAGGTWVPLDLLRGHIGDGTPRPLRTRAERAGAVGDRGYATGWSGATSPATIATGDIKQVLVEKIPIPTSRSM